MATTFPLPNNSTDLSGQVALVTGASSGLGWRFAQTLAASGAHVAIAARRTDKLDALTELIRGAGGTCLPVTLDMTDADQIMAAAETVENELGPISILVNNAGIPDAQYAVKMSVEFIDLVMDTNLRGPFILACEVARRMMANKVAGRIVNISSIGAYHYGGGASALYSVTKAGVVRMTEALAVEWARYNINVNAMAPGLFISEMTDGMIARIGDMTDRTPRKRLGDPAQLDSTLLYLVSPASEMVTGTVIKVDDGQTPR
jgi:NAD(P)-dependent dehydrogenase (short-subunit alcohol dehydrogenase family)